MCLLLPCNFYFPQHLQLNGRIHLFMIQVDLERSALEKVEDEKNQISKADFVKLGQDMKLLDFGGALGEKRKPQSPRVERRRRESKELETPRSERKRINSNRLSNS